MDYTPPPAAIYHQHLASPASSTALGARAISFAFAGEPSVDERAKYDFTYTWFEQVLSGWAEITAPLVGKPLKILEVGSFEGGSTTWILDHLMDHEDSTLTAIDSFGGGNESAPGEYDLSGLEQKFWHNIHQAKNSEKLHQLKGSSHDLLVQLRSERADFDFVYIDGSHMAIDVLQDAMLIWPMLKEGGTIVFDDFNWQKFKQEYYAPNIAITSFLRCAAPTLVWFEKNGQLWAKKVPNTTPPEPF